jgi:hypothetical protein
MKKFIQYLILFNIPIVFFLVLVELYCRTQTTFALNKNYLENNLGNIETLILGSSHSQNGINPEFLKSKSCNLAFGGQPISIDYFLLDKYVLQMKNLKTIFFEVSPHRFYNELNPKDWNGHIYSNLYDINYKVERFSIKKYSFVLSDVRYISTIFINNFNPKLPKPELNEFGFMKNNYQGRFSKLNNDSIKINKTFKMNHHFDNQENLKQNIVFLKKIIEKCKKNNIKIIFLGTPFYQTYSSKIPLKSEIQIHNLLTHFSSKYKIPYYDLAKSKRFNLKDFVNDNHLNPDGAKKFTLITNNLETHYSQQP